MPRAGAASAAAAARQARQRKANRPEYRPEELLADEALVQTTRFSSLKPQPTGRGRERHDLCVLLQQQKAAYKGLFRTDLQATDGSGSPGAFAQDSSFTEVPPECSSTVHGEAAAALEGQTSTELALQISTFSETESNEGWPLRRKCGVSLWVLVPEDIPEMPRTVFFCVSESNPVRWACIRLALSPWFDWAVLFVICTSSMMMALDAPGVGPELKRVIVYCDELTLYIFTMEMLVKVLAFGLWCGRGTYLTNSWNRLDALVVFSGWISLITSQQGECDVFGLFFCAESSSGGANFNSIRTVRVLRPLKAMNQLPGMKALVTTLLTSLPDLMDSMILCGFCLVLFGIIGVQLFMGCLRQVCMPSADSVTTLPPSSWGYKDVGLGSLCSLDHHGNGHCVEGFTCVADAASNPNGGVTSFDSLPFAMLAVFQSITLEGWVDIMYDIRKVKHLFNDAYFIGLILFGSLFMTNLVVGVLVSNFIDASAAATVVDADGEPVEEAKTSSVLVREYIQKMEPSMLCIFRRYCFKLSSSERFNYAMITLIALNTLTLALDNIISDDVLEIFNVVFTILFTLEMLIKIIGFGPKLYSLDGFNNFDFVIVVFSLVELVISRTMGMAGGGSLTALRTFRLLRVFKLARSMKSLRKILDAVMGSLGAIGHLGVLLGMFMFVCALTGMASYGTTEEELQDPEGTGQRWTLEEDGYYRGRMTRPNFSTFLYSMTTVFIIITGENWNEVMYTSVQKNGWSSALYFILIMLIGNYIILNLFLAILIQKFDSGADDGADDKVSEAEDHPTRQQSYCSNSTSSSFMYSLQNNVGPKRKKSLGSLPEELDPGAGIVRPSLLGEGSLSRMSFPEIVDDGASGVQNLEPVEGGNGLGPRGAESQPQVGLDDRTVSFSSSGKGSDLAVASPGVVRERAVSFDEADRGVVREREVSFDDGGSENIGAQIESMKKTFTSSGTTFDKKSTPSGTASGAIRDIISSQGFHCSECFGIGWAKALRQRLLHNVLQNPWFDETIYGLIAVSAIILAMESPDQEDPEMKHTFFVFDCVLSTLFTLEAILKIFVHGFICGPSSYLRNSWNVLDLFVVVTSLINITLTQLSSGGHSRSFAWVKGLRALRALRPLRMVSRSEGLKVVVDSLFQAAPSIRDVTLVLMLFLTIFSILGVQLFKNKFNRCSCLDFCPQKSFKPGSEAARGKPIERICEGSCPGAPPHLQTCLWERHPRWSFDNVFRAFLTLFEVCTLELWMDVMWLAVDGKSPDEAPEYNNSPIAVLFFILFLFIMSFFILNLFVGVVIDKFSSVRNEMLGFTIFSERQMHWITTQRMLMKMKPRPLLIVPDNKWRQAAMQLIALPEFEWAIIGLIISNMLVMGTSFYGASTGVRRLQENANQVFVVFFTVEAALKIFALRPKLYFRSKWNTFDFIILSGSLLQEISENIGIDATVLRMIRVARIFRLVRSQKGLQRLFATLVASLPSLAHIGVMLLLLFFVYTVAGMALFGDIQIKGNPELLAMSPDVNFTNFYFAMVMLFRISTGESWNSLMHDCFNGARCAEPPHEAKCGNTIVAIGFFVSFMILGSFVFVNLFIAVIIEKLFENEEDQDPGCLSIMLHDLESFVDCWSQMSPDGNPYIPTVFLPKLLQGVDPPLGFNGEVMRQSSMIRCVSRLGIRDHGGKVHFVETLWRLASMVSGADMRDVAGNAFLQHIDTMVMRAWPMPMPEGQRCRPGVMHLAAEVIVATRIQGLWRGKLAKRMFFKVVREAKRQHIERQETVGEASQNLATGTNGASENDVLTNQESRDDELLPAPPLIVAKHEQYEQCGPGEESRVFTEGLVSQKMMPEIASRPTSSAPPLLSSVLASCSTIPTCVVSCDDDQEFQDIPQFELMVNGVDLPSNGCFPNSRQVSCDMGATAPHLVANFEQQPELPPPWEDHPECHASEDDIIARERRAGSGSFNLPSPRSPSELPIEQSATAATSASGRKLLYL